MTTQLCTLTTDVFMGNIHSTLLCYLNLNLETMLCHVGVLLLNNTLTVIIEVSVWQLGKVQIYTALLLCYLNLNLETMLCHVGVLLLNNTFTVIIEMSVWQLGKVQSSTFSSYSVVNTNSRIGLSVAKSV